jgi:threonine synthase
MAVSDDEILSAQNEFIELTGILCEPSSAAVYAAFKKLLAEDKIKSSDRILLLITGNGLKDVAALKRMES